MVWIKPERLLLGNTFWFVTKICRLFHSFHIIDISLSKSNPIRFLHRHTERANPYFVLQRRKGHVPAARNEAKGQIGKTIMNGLSHVQIQQQQQVTYLYITSDNS
jgi:hypothetical protein